MCIKNVILPSGFTQTGIEWCGGMDLGGKQDYSEGNYSIAGKGRNSGAE